jgi:hypothetical protein
MLLWRRGARIGPAVGVILPNSGIRNSGYWGKDQVLTSTT